MGQYIFERHKEDRELNRLRMIEAARDPSTIELLERTGIQTGWNCLELGPGAGSILKWIGKKVGPSGLVIGVDKKPHYLGEYSSPPFDIREGDFLEVELVGPFDLIYARYFLIHNKRNMDSLLKIHGLLKPDGYAVLEEPDFTSAKYLNDSSETSHQRVNSAICKMFVDFGLDPAYGIRLPQRLRAAGFAILDAHSTIHLCAGNSPIAKLMGKSALALSQEYLKTGEATEKDIQKYEQNTHNPGYWSVYYSTTSLIAKQGTVGNAHPT